MEYYFEVDSSLTSYCNYNDFNCILSTVLKTSWQAKTAEFTSYIENSNGMGICNPKKFNDNYGGQEGSAIVASC